MKSGRRVVASRLSAHQGSQLGHWGKRLFALLKYLGSVNASTMASAADTARKRNHRRAEP
ncbi:hypothetical protein [Oceanidesulfovibrio marinus]|nr:hypothetical protein [Oceanidesulfovibrio marinus]